jgi:hypothetical protein
MDICLFWLKYFGSRRWFREAVVTVNCRRLVNRQAKRTPGVGSTVMVVVKSGNQYQEREGNDEEKYSGSTIGALINHVTPSEN